MTTTYQLPDRLRIDLPTRAVYLDGHLLGHVEDPLALQVFEYVARAGGRIVNKVELAHFFDGTKEPRPHRLFRKYFPPAILKLVVSKRGHGGGYALKLPPV